MQTALTIVAAVLGSLAGLACVGAGVYVLSWTSPADRALGAMASFDTNGLDVLEHAVGVYFIGKGIGLWAMTLLALRRSRS